MLIFTWIWTVPTKLILMRHLVLCLFKPLTMKSIYKIIYTDTLRNTLSAICNRKQARFQMRSPLSLTVSVVTTRFSEWFQDSLTTAGAEFQDFLGQWHPCLHVYLLYLRHLLFVIRKITTLIIRFLFTISYSSWCRHHCIAVVIVLSKKCSEIFLR